MEEVNRVIKLSPTTLDARAADIRKAVEADGWALLEPWADDVNTLRKVGSLFGTIQSHIRADEQGVVGVGGPQRSAEWQAYRSEYHGLGTGDVAPHTDGTFVDGVVGAGAGLRRVAPPRFVILQVVRHADEGGANVVVDAQQVLTDLLHKEPQMAQVLMTPGSVTFCRDDQLALDRAVYAFAGQGHFKVRFRGDSKSFAPQWAQSALERLHKEWHHSCAFRATVDVGEGQVLVVDNTRVLHGREPFSNEDDGATAGRKLRRLWILDGDLSPRLENIEGQPSQSRALKTYEPYASVPNEVAVESPIDMDTGIRLDAGTMEIAAGLMRDTFEAQFRQGAPS